MDTYLPFWLLRSICAVIVFNEFNWFAKSDEDNDARVILFSCNSPSVAFSCTSAVVVELSVVVTVVDVLKLSRLVWSLDGAGLVWISAFFSLLGTEEAFEAVIFFGTLDSDEWWWWWWWLPTRVVSFARSGIAEIKLSR